MSDTEHMIDTAYVDLGGALEYAAKCCERRAASLTDATARNEAEKCAANIRYHARNVHFVPALADTTLRTAREVLAKRVAELETPDHLMPPHSECAYLADDLTSLDDDMEVPIGEYRRVLAFKTLPDRWLARVVVTRDEHGDPDETELRLFAIEADAEAAIRGEAPPTD